MPRYLSFGELPPKRHIKMKRPKNESFLQEGLYYEHVLTLAGFDRGYSCMYHLRPPTRMKHIEEVSRKTLKAAAASIRPFHLRSQDIPRQGNMIGGRIPMIFNDDFVLSRCRPAKEQKELYRNAGGSEMIFFFGGSGIMESPFGKLPYKQNDYLIIPQGVTYRLRPDDINKEDHLIIETPDLIDLPKRYLNADGQLKLGAPFYERSFHGPAELITIDDESDCQVLIKEGPLMTRVTFAHHLFDVVAWDGMAYPYTFNALDFEPLTGTVHLPPPFQQTFEAAGIVICTFAPRYLDHHPEAIKIPYAHSNTMMDELLFYAQGQFGSRKGVGPGSITLHPRALTHSPHPGTIMASEAHSYTDELAVMIDSCHKMFVCEEALPYDVNDYPQSWMEQ